MALLTIPRTNYFDKNILPKIDALTSANSCTRSDVLRDIFYSSFKYSPSPRSKEQIEADCEIEISTERKRGKDKCIAVSIDSQFQDILMYYWVARPGTYHQAINHILSNYFEESLDVVDAELRATCTASVTEPVASTGPWKGHVTVKKVNTCKS